MLRKVTPRRLFWLVVGSDLFFIALYRLWLRSFLLDQLAFNPDPLDKIYYTEIFASLDLCALVFLSLIILAYCLRKPLVRLIARIDDKFVLALCLALLIVVELGLIVVIRTIPLADSSYYIALSERLFRTGRYVSASGALTAFWPVGLPAYLCLLRFVCSDYILLAKVVNVAISAATVYVLYSLAKNEMPKNSIVILVVLSALYPNNVFSATIIMPDHVFSLLLWTLVLITYKKNLNYYVAVIQGVILAIASYLRPVGLLLPLLFIIYYIKFGRAQKHEMKVAAMVGVFVVLMFPWMYRNAEVFHSMVPISTNGGYNFLMGNHHGSGGGVNFDFPYNLSEPNESVENAVAYSNSFKDIIEHPLESLVRLPKKIFHAYYRGDSSVTWSLKQTENNVPALFKSASFFLANQVFYIVVGVSLLGMILHSPAHGKQKKYINPKLSFLLWAVYFYSIAMILVYVGTERYIIPVMPVHFFFFATYWSSFCSSE